MPALAEAPARSKPDAIGRDAVLAALRCGCARADLFRFGLKEIGVLLSSNAITTDDALAEIADLGATEIVFMRRGDE